jgi:acetyl esterase
VEVSAHLLPDAAHGTLNEPFTAAGASTVDLLGAWLAPK